MDEFLKRIVTARQRQRRGWTTKELAQASDEAHSNVLRWERGEGAPNAKGLAMVARACGVTTDWLLGRDAVESIAVLRCIKHEGGAGADQADAALHRIEEALR